MVEECLKEWIRNLCKCTVIVNLLSPVNQLFERNCLLYSTLCNIYFTAAAQWSARRSSCWWFADLLVDLRRPVRSPYRRKESSPVGSRSRAIAFSHCRATVSAGDCCGLEPIRSSGAANDYWLLLDRSGWTSTSTSTSAALYVNVWRDWRWLSGRLDEWVTVDRPPRAHG